MTQDIVKRFEDKLGKNNVTTTHNNGEEYVCIGPIHLDQKKTTQVLRADGDQFQINDVRSRQAASKILTLLDNTKGAVYECQFDEDGLPELASTDHTRKIEIRKDAITPNKLPTILSILEGAKLFERTNEKK